MEFFFTKNDGIYQIFKLLEKLPPQRNVEIFIDPEHGFFDNLWRGQQVKEIITKRKLTITFQTQKEKNRKFYLQSGLNVNYQAEKQIVKFFKILGIFFIDIKKFHLQTFDKQKYLFFLIFFFELTIGLVLLWFLIILIIPKATITLYPAQQNESVIYNFRFYPNNEEKYLGAIKQISIPYYTGHIKHNHEMSIIVSNLQYLQNPSQGLVNIYNQTAKAITLVPHTRFVTDDKLVFLTNESITLPSGSKDSPSETKTILYAAELDENGDIIGIKGNLNKGVPLLIRNLKESYYLKEIWADVLEQFEGGKVTTTGNVTLGDIKLLENRIKNTVYADKLNIIHKYFRIPNAVLLSFDSLVKTNFEHIIIPTSLDSDNLEVKGIAQIKFDILYLSRDDIYNAFKYYISERPSDNIELINIDKSSFIFMEEPSFLINEEVFMAPIKINILQAYDFKKDTKNIITTVKETILGTDINTARKLILEHPEVGSVDIKVSNFGGTTLPTLKSRVKIKVTK